MYATDNLTANLHLLLPEFLIAGLAFLVITIDFLLPRERKNVLAVIAVLGLAIIGIFSIIYLGGKENASLYEGIFVIDRYSLVFKVIFLGMGALVILASIDFVKKHLHHPGEYYGIILFSILGMMLMAASNELLTAYISLELLSFSLYILVSISRDNQKSDEAGVKYIILGAFASAILLYGVSIIYGTLGTTTFEGIGQAMGSGLSVSPHLLVGMAFILSGLAFKIAAVPFHMWTPDVYEGAPLPITAYLAIGSKAAAFALILRLFSTSFMQSIEEWHLVIAVIAAVTMTFGNLSALAQSNIKRLLAYSSIGQVGYLLVGIAALSTAASNSIILHIIGYGLANLAAFSVITIFYNSTGKENVNDFAGLAKRNPFLAMVLTVSLFSLAGLPFFAGFITKFYLFIAAAKEDLLWLAGIAMVNSLISLYYYLIIIKQMYITPVKDDGDLKISAHNSGLLIFLVLGTIIIGIYPGPLVDIIETATKVILPAT
jgi:NADH-quinone oxidoreductase subunit N